MPNFSYLASLAKFCIRTHPAMLANTGLAVISVVVELIAMASLLPLSLIAVGQTFGSESIWGRMFSAFSIQPTFSNAMLIFLSMFATRLVSQFANNAISIYWGKKIQAELSARAFSAILKNISLRDIEKKTAGHFISLAGDETARAGAMVVTANQLIAALLLSTVYLVSLFILSLWVGLSVMLFLAVVFVSLLGIFRKSQTLSTSQLTLVKIAHSVFLDALNGIRSVRAMSAEDYVTQKYEDIIHRYTRTHFLIEVIGSTARFVPALLLLVLAAAAVIAGVIAPRGLTEIAFVFTTLAFLLRFFPAIGHALNLFLRFITDAKAASDVTHILDAEDASSSNIQAPGRKAVERVELSNLTFGYDPSKPVFQGLRASFAKGRSYAIVGPSGPGKSTLLDLMLGFYQPDAGTIRFNDVPLPEIGNRNIRKRVLLVGQQTTILNDTVYNNVRFGLDVRDAMVEEACVVACIDEDIRSFELKYETILSYQGSNLSGGQRQRIGIARAILRDPDVILLDESTSGLDAQTRDRVVGHILGRYKDRIVIFSTHDQVIMQRVDEIVTLESDARLPA